MYSHLLFRMFPSPWKLGRDYPVPAIGKSAQILLNVITYEYKNQFHYFPYH